jgi:hypothetical protein
VTAVKATAAATNNETMPFGLRHIIVVESKEEKKENFCSRLSFLTFDACCHIYVKSYF